ncbi:MAG: GHKL domain-containing protein [Lachnospiraceae bacterium]|nr:GHKL domain-containing protein [Lachnospiraceae bacterium]
MIWRVIISIIDFWIAIIVYSLLLDAKFNSVKKIIAVNLTYIIGGLICLFAEIRYGWILLPIEGFSFLCFFLIPVICIDGKKQRWKYCIAWPIVFFEMSLIVTFFAHLTASIIDIPQSSINNGTWMACAAEILALCVILLFAFLKNRIHVKERYNRAIDLIRASVIFSGVVCSYLFADLLSYINRTNDYTFNEIFSYLLHFLSLYFFIISLWLWFSDKKNKEYREEINRYNDYLKEQERFIHLQIDSDEKIRRIRHDMNANIDAMAALAASDDTDELKKFIVNLKGKKDSSAIRRFSGIVAVDAVIGGVIEKHGWKNTDIRWRGFIPSNCKVEIYDLCVIVSNLLSNAIEACDRENLQRDVEVTVTGEGDLFSLVLKNRTNFSKDLNTNRKTAKTDAVEHGFGIKNVTDVMKKYGGELKYKNEDGYILAIAIF